jgi:hypothetical protein
VVYGGGESPHACRRLFPAVRIGIGQRTIEGQPELVLGIGIGVQPELQSWQSGRGRNQTCRRSSRAVARSSLFINLVAFGSHANDAQVGAVADKLGTTRGGLNSAPPPASRLADCGARATGADRSRASLRGFQDDGAGSGGHLAACCGRALRLKCRTGGFDPLHGQPTTSRSLWNASFTFATARSRQVDWPATSASIM